MKSLFFSQVQFSWSKEITGHLIANEMMETRSMHCGVSIVLVLTSLSYLFLDSFWWEDQIVKKLLIEVTHTFCA